MDPDDHDLLIRIHENVKQLHRDVVEHRTEVSAHWVTTDARLQVLESWRWKIVGAAVVVGVMTSVAGTAIARMITNGGL